MMFALKNQGTELQAEAFRHPDLLVVYGSSEMEKPAVLPNRLLA